jgi:hypothetical protein
MQACSVKILAKQTCVFYDVDEGDLLGGLRLLF